MQALLGWLRKRILRWPLLDPALILPLLVASGLIFWQIVLHPVIGLADNGDFGWVTRPVGLDSSTVPGHHYTNVVINWKFIPPDHFQVVWGTVQLIAPAVIYFFHLFGGGEYFDIRIWGVLHALIALGGLALFLRAVQASRIPTAWRMLIGFSAALMLSDTSNAFHFNSFYYIGVTLALSGWVIGVFGLVAADGVITRLRVVLAVAVSVAFMWSKIQLAPVGMLLAALLLSFTAYANRPQQRLWLNLAALCVFASSLVLAAYPGIGHTVRRYIGSINACNALMAGIASGSKDPISDLHELGVEDEYIHPRLIGQDCNELEKDAEGMVLRGKWVERIDRTSGISKIIRFAVVHPMRFIKLMDSVIEHQHLYRSYNLGMYESGTPPNVNKQLFLWRSLRGTLFHIHSGLLWLLGAVALGATVSAVVLGGRRKRLDLAGGWALVAALTLMVLSQLIVVPLVSGLPGIDKHLYPFQLLLDWLLLVVAWWVVTTVSRRHHSPGV